MISVVTEFLERPFLSVGIPTYKRVRELRIALARLQASGANFVGKVEFIVVDNDPSGSALEVCDSFKDLNIRYFPNDSGRRSCEESLVLIHKHYTGEYLYLLGDDDFVFPEFFSAIFVALTQRPLFVFTNYLGDDHKPAFAPWIVKILGRSNTLFAWWMHYRLGFISEFVMSRKCVETFSFDLKYGNLAFLNQALKMLRGVSSKHFVALESPNFVASRNSNFTEDIAVYWRIFVSDVLGAIRPVASTLPFILWLLIFGRLPRVLLSSKPKYSFGAAENVLMFILFYKSLLFGKVSRRSGL